MCDQNNLGTGGPPYKPSARKSIHNHENCIFADCNRIMGRYGLKSRYNEQPKTKDTSIQEGIDVVDNVMSKPVHQSSPLHMNTKGRRNSLHTPDKNDEDVSSDSKLLAKSLPANMPSYYSDEYVTHQSLPSDFYKGHDDSSPSLTRTPNDSRSYRHDSFETRHFNRREELSLREEAKQHSDKKYLGVLLPICGLISLAVAVYYGEIFNIAQVHSKNVYDEITFSQEIGNLGEKYQIGEQPLLELQTGITTISERNDSGSFIFVYNRRLQLNHIQFNNFIEDIALAAAKYLRNNSMPSGPTIVHSSQLNMKSHSELMNTYRHDIAKTGVMLVKDMDMIPSYLAMAFHYFCDEYNPLVSKAAIFFTLNLESCAEKSSEKLRPTYQDIEKCLTNKWNAIPEDNIKPLLTRVVNVIIDLSGIS
ncbi:unnamed protein product [Diatraea saccharalis]|uniref:Uncharacterized protein n=1 Tax=Diatraea saccharalis TaxID=40085 RepID=A0A9N9WA40_9NEOP|nr:unnamed protein product [Diatraea saccharalis]